MPIPSHKNLLDVLGKFRENAQERAGISLFQRDGKFRAISETLTNEALSLKEEQVRQDYLSRLSNARGKALDEIGDKLGMPRIRAEHARADLVAHSVAFYVESGTFGAINSGNSITVPINTRIRSRPNQNELNTSVEYQTLQTVTLNAADDLQYVGVRAVNIGTASNVGETVLRTHNVTAYTDSANQSLKVVNFYPIINGVDDEQDDLYRYRLANHYNQMITNNETKLRLAALRVGGVVNTRVEPGYFGIGTAGVFGLGPENQSNVALIESLQDRLEAFRTPGGYYVATPGSQVAFDLYMRLKPSKTLTNQQSVRLKAELNKAVLMYFRTLTMGSTVDLSVLLNEIQTNVSVVAPFINKKSDQVFYKVYVRKGLAGGAMDERARMTGLVYNLSADEFPSLGTLNIEFI